MTSIPARLARLYLDSRQTRTTLAMLAAAAAALRATQPVTREPGIFPELTLMLLTLAAAAIIATATRNPFGETERTSSSPLPALRLTHVAILIATAAATTTAAGWTASYAISPPAIIRNLAGFTGIALLTAAVLGAHLAWTMPLGYIIYCGAQLDAQDYSLRSWPILPATNHAATAIAVGLLIAGITTATITGARNRRSDLPGTPRIKRLLRTQAPARAPPPKPTGSTSPGPRDSAYRRR